MVMIYVDGGCQELPNELKNKKNGSGYQCKSKGKCRRGYRPFLRLAVATMLIVGEEDSEAMMNGGEVDVTRSYVAETP